MLTNGDMANPEDPVGMQGDTIWVHDTNIYREMNQEDVGPTMDLTAVQTPTTPSDGCSERSRGRDVSVIVTPTMDTESEGHA